MDKFRIDGEVAVITGTGGGIGRSLSELFARSGASVVVSDLDKIAADEVVNNIEVDGGQALAVACDVTDDNALENLVQKSLDRFGKISLLVNNAGGGGPKPFDMDIKTFRKVFDLNVFSIFRLCQLCAPYMEENGGGAILNISSMAAENKNKDMSAYGASKAAVSHFTRNIAFDLGPKGIRVNGIAPGAIKTDALKKVLTPEIEDNMLKHTPIKRLGEAEDIANGALFLCSPAANWISGQILTISGGGTQELG
ncbi:7-alpha-hydroxysteroid dehydrogenase [uncultured Idiomarina sp.]|uniref:7-alpha-hydroxysteroid dehydrogenase n=1 Tax=uncultured Idiomarina sp. TaxID=352961 RepID=UPI0025957258|nr:7-alpha-hydroxysteroid dehydrogenase [uncultured Idiomarina sp.]